MAESDSPKREKSIYVGPPHFWRLYNACELINKSLGPYGCYLVGSCTERPDYRDVDVRFIMEDAAFDALFPCVETRIADSYVNPRWNLICLAITTWLREETGLPIDFQIQRMSHSNSQYRGKTRHPLGGYVSMEKPREVNNQD